MDEQLGPFTNNSNRLEEEKHNSLNSPSCKISNLTKSNDGADFLMFLIPTVNMFYILSLNFNNKPLLSEEPHKIKNVWSLF